jgi:hypothetical protein
MYLHGGVYADLDVELIRPLDRLLEQKTGAVVASMGRDSAFPHSIPKCAGCPAAQTCCSA